MSQRLKKQKKQKQNKKQKQPKTDKSSVPTSSLGKNALSDSHQRGRSRPSPTNSFSFVYILCCARKYGRPAEKYPGGGGHPPHPTWPLFASSRRQRERGLPPPPLPPVVTGVGNGSRSRHRARATIEGAPPQLHISGDWRRVPSLPFKTFIFLCHLPSHFATPKTQDGNVRPLLG